MPLRPILTAAAVGFAVSIGQYLPTLLALLADWDLVLGCRYMPGGGVEGWGLHRRLLSRGGTAYARIVLGLPFRDLTGGFKCFRREVLETLQRDGSA